MVTAAYLGAVVTGVVLLFFPVTDFGGPAHPGKGVLENTKLTVLAQG